MERIQQAIAKARAEREAYGEMPSEVLRLSNERAANSQPKVTAAPPSSQPRVTAPSPADQPVEPPDLDPERNESIPAAWDALPALRLDQKACERNHIVSVTGGNGAAEVDGIRTRLLQQLKARGFRSVALTSPGPGCGKSTVAANLAFSLSRQQDQRTILADVDLRRPNLAKTLGIVERHSFAKVLSGEARFPDQALRHGDNLALASTYAPAANPAELLQSRRAAETLTDIRDQYDPTVMLFDLPPLRVNDDAMAFLNQVDCALIVAAAEKTTIKDIDRCERDVGRETFVLGVILNRCRYMDRSDGYSAYYA